VSEANLELVRRGQAGFNRGDLSGMQDQVTPDVDWGAVGAFPGLADTYRGRGGLDEWMDAVRTAFSDFEVSLEEVLRDEDEMSVVVEHLHGHGRESGAEVEMRVYSVYWFTDGKIAKRRAFTSRDEALAAAEA
jgi:ketosteroid isomerase-like protein